MTVSFFKSIFLIIPTLITFLQLMYQTNANNPFATHPTAMGLAVCASLVFYLACSGQLALLMMITRRCSTACIVNRFMVWSGNALVASMASLLIPTSLRPLLYLVFASISAAESLHGLWMKVLDGSRGLYHRRRCWFCRSVSGMTTSMLWMKVLDGSRALYHRRRCWFCRSVSGMTASIESPRPPV